MIRLQLETIRLYPPIIALPKYTASRQQNLKSGNITIPIVPHTIVTPSLLAIHTHPKYWKEEPTAWRPKRWISSASPKTPSSEATLAVKLDIEEIMVPIKGSYFPWSDGPQSCPGKKFSQVEFVAVIACILQQHRVRPLFKEGECFDSAQKRMVGVCENSGLTVLLRMRDADSVKLVWERKSDHL